MVKSLPHCTWLALATALGVASGEPASAQRLDATELESHLADWNAAVAAGEYARVLLELDSLEDPAQDPRLLNLHGVCLIGLGRPAESIADFEAAIRRDPTAPQAHRNLAIALDALGQLGRSMSEFEQALELDPDDEEARLGLAHAQIRVRRFAAAKSTLKGSRSPDDLRLLQARASLGEASADSAEARSAWSQIELEHPSAESARQLARWSPSQRARWLSLCLERDPAQIECREALGQLWLETGDAAACASTLRPLLDAGAPSAAALHNLLLALQQLRAWAELESVCARHPPAAAESWGVVALARREAGELGPAREAAARARQFAPEDLDLANLEAVLLAELGQRPQALEIWRWILERDPEHREARRNVAAQP